MKNVRFSSPAAVLLLAAVLVAGASTFAVQSAGGGGGNAPAVTHQYDMNARFVPDEVLVKFVPEVDAQEAALLAVEQSLKPLDRIATVNLYRMAILDGSGVWEAARRLARDPRVVYAEPNFIDEIMGESSGVMISAPTQQGPDLVPGDPFYPNQWHYPLINMPAAWDITTGSGNVIVAVVDSGVRFDHPDLAPRLSANGYDFIDGDSNPTDPSNGHGTHVAGTIGAATNNALGVAGMDWNCVILPIRGLGTHFQMAQSFRYAAGLLTPPDPVNPTPAQVINYSGGGSHSATKEAGVADADAAGVVMCCAAGNDVSGPVIYPAAYSTTYANVVCVGATNYGNGSPTQAWYSNVGPEMNVVAPGGDTSVDSDGDGFVDGVLSTAWNYATGAPVYEFWQGTSMATPHVSGLAALLIANGLDPTSVKLQLELTTTDLGAAGFDNTYGYGLIDGPFALTGWTTFYGDFFDGGPGLKVLRNYRDSVLYKMREGKLYTDLLYQHSAEALVVLIRNPRLALRAKYLVDQNLEAVARVLQGREGVILYSDAIIDFLHDYAGESSSSLKHLAETVAERMADSKRLGKSFLGFTLR